MKLKLEQLECGTLLSVTESIEPEQVAVIKAGLTKILQSTSRAGAPPLPLLIDLCDLPETDLRADRIASRFLSLKAWAACQGFEVFVAAPVPDLAEAGSRAAGIELLGSSPARESALQAICEKYAEKLERQKHALEKKLSTLESSASSLRKLRKENSDLRKRIRFTEAQIRELVTTQNPAGTFEENAARLRTAELTLTAVLEKQGILTKGESL